MGHGQGEESHQLEKDFGRWVSRVSRAQGGCYFFLLGSRGCRLNIHSGQPLEKPRVRNKMGLSSVDRCGSLIIYSWSSGDHRLGPCGKTRKGLLPAHLAPTPPPQALPASLQRRVSSSQFTQACPDLPSPPSSAPSLGSGSENRLSISLLPSPYLSICTAAVGCPREIAHDGVTSECWVSRTNSATGHLAGLLAASSTRGRDLFSEQHFLSWLLGPRLPLGSVTCVRLLNYKGD